MPHTLADIWEGEKVMKPNSELFAELMIQLNDFLEDLKERGISKKEIIQEVENVYKED